MTSPTKSLIEQDFFSLFHLPRQIFIDQQKLTNRYHHLQKKFHPDCFANQPPMVQRVALEIASRINDAYRTLKTPLSCAIYLLSLLGHQVLSEDDNTSIATNFLEKVMLWRESISLHEKDDVTLTPIIDEIYSQRQKIINTVCQAIEQNNLSLAVDEIRCWIYIEKILDQIKFK